MVTHKIEKTKAGDTIYFVENEEMGLRKYSFALGNRVGNGELKGISEIMSGRKINTVTASMQLGKDVHLVIENFINSSTQLAKLNVDAIKLYKAFPENVSLACDKFKLWFLEIYKKSIKIIYTEKLVGAIEDGYATQIDFVIDFGLYNLKTTSLEIQKAITLNREKWALQLAGERRAIANMEFGYEKERYLCYVLVLHLGEEEEKLKLVPFSNKEINEAEKELEKKFMNARNPKVKGNKMVL